MNCLAYLSREFEFFLIGGKRAIKGEISMIRFLFQKKCPGNTKKKELKSILLQ